MTITRPTPGQVLHHLGGNLDVRVEIDTGFDPLLLGGRYDVAQYDVDVYGSLDAAWQDVTEYVQGIEINRGAARWGEMFENGSCRIVVQNITGIFTPDSDVEAFPQPFHPGRRMRVVCIPDPDDPLTKEPIFTGIIDASNDSYDDAAYDINTIITAQDFMSQWAGVNPVEITIPTKKELTSIRVTRILNEMDWPNDAEHRDIQGGSYEMMSSNLPDNYLSEMQHAAWAEGGAIFCDREGRACFKSRNWLQTDPRSIAVQGWLGFSQVPEGSQAGMVTEITPSWERARIVNQVKFAKVGDPGQTMVEDLPSQQSIGAVRSFEKLDFQLHNPSYLSGLATRYLTHYRENRMRVDSVTFNGQDDPDNDGLNKLMYETEFGDLMAIKLDTPYGWEIIRFAQVFGISHQITGEDWQVTFRLDDIATQPGGAIFDIEITFEGGGINPVRQGGAELEVHLHLEGQGQVVEKAGGSEFPIHIGFTGAGRGDRGHMVAQLGAVAWWVFGESETADKSGNGHTLTWTADPTSVSTGGPLGKGYVDLAEDAWATVAGDDALAIRGDMTIEMWQRDGGPHPYAITNEAGFAASKNLLFMSFSHANPPSTFGDVRVGPTTAAGSTANDVLYDNVLGAHENWLHLVLVVDADPSGTQRTFRLYIDGVDKGVKGPYGIPTEAPQVVTIAKLSPSYVGNSFEGELAEIAIYGRALTATEVADLYGSRYG